jgi:hypothetical protein
MDQIVDVSLAKLYNILVGLYEDYFMKHVEIPLVTNKADYELPTDLMKLRTIFYKDQSSFQLPLSRLALTDLLNLPQATIYMNRLIGYFYQGTYVTLYPVPNGTSIPLTIKVYYIPQYTPPLNDNTPIMYQFASGWDEWCVNDIAIQIRNKAMMPAEELVRERADLEAKIIHQARQRDAGQPKRVRDSGFTANPMGTLYSPFALR